jgi:hypothetical protein
MIISNRACLHSLSCLKSDDIPLKFGIIEDNVCRGDWGFRHFKAPE